ncbi:MAG: glycosyltransferase family 4 protein [Ferruginibacter sp.]|nr:glycosyltransferase family 4 protein [Ferruginibacter sp.]NOU38842.1 glycosyltransferase family 4 protein [Ferruginibacter sp.]
MKILLDPQVYAFQTYGGISRYYTEIFSRLKNKKDLSILNSVLITKNVYFNQSNLYGKPQKRLFYFVTFLNKMGISIRSKTKNINTNFVKRKLKLKNFDLFIPTYYGTYFLEYIDNKPFVLTVYDMIHELYPQYFINDPLEVTKNKKILLEKATKIIAVSKNTKKDILKIYPHIDSNKIEVIYHGNSIYYAKSITVNLPEKYILFVGERANYKNFIFMLESLKDVLHNNKTIHIICAGGGKFTVAEKNKISELGLENQVIQKYFEDNELGTFYHNAICFIFPSEYEGFGIPILEAMACSCPIILTNNSSFPEVAGEAGIYFELNNLEDLKNKVKMLIENNSTRREYIKKGLERSKLFSWEKAATDCLNVYKAAI